MMLSPVKPVNPVKDAKEGKGTLSQVQACQRQVSELRASLSLLAERCGCLEDVHKGAIEKLRAFGSSPTGGQATLEQLKKQSTAKVRGLQNRHGELMRLLQDELSGYPVETLDKLATTDTGKSEKTTTATAPLQGAAGKTEGTAVGAAVPLTLESEPETDKVTVMPTDRVGKVNSRLRFSSTACDLAVSELLELL